MKARHKSTGGAESNVVRIPGLRDAKPPDFDLLDFEGLTWTRDADYRVKGIIPRKGIGTVWGPGEVGKTFVLTDLCLHVALGIEYRGHRVRQGSVVYCAFEGQGQYGKRIAAWRKFHCKELDKWRKVAGDDSRVPFHVMPDSLTLVDAHKALIASIRAHEVSPSVVVLDTLNRSFHDTESSDKAMREYIDAAEVIRDTFDCVVIIVHHPGHEGWRPRGSSALRPATEFQIALYRDPEDKEIIVAEVERMKDGESGLKVASRLRVVELGEDKDGDAVTSCVVVTAAVPKKVVKLTDRERGAIDALDACKKDKQGRVSVEAWKVRLYEDEVLDKEAANTREDLRRLQKSLVKKERVKIEGEFIWHVSECDGEKAGKR